MGSRQARFEIVRSDAGWFARFRAANGRKVWQTEVYDRRWNADRAVAMLWENYDAHLVVDVDERTPEFVPPPPSPPFWYRTTIYGHDLWHDSEYHYRNCFGDECEPAAADLEAGTMVATRFGPQEFKATA